MEYDLILRKDETLRFASTQMELECVLTNEISMVEKDKHKITL